MITENEYKLLKAIFESEFNEVPDEEKPGNPVWTNCLWDWSGKARFGGVAASLQKKGLANFYNSHPSPKEHTCAITQEGLDAMKAYEGGKAK